MTQASLLDQIEHAQNLRRVSGNISPLILRYLRTLQAGAEFSMEQLTRFVRQQLPTAPDSAGRILRDLRQRGLCDYECINRAASRYRLLSVESEAA